MTKITTDQCLGLDIKSLIKLGIVEAGRSGTLSWSNGSQISYACYSDDSDRPLTLELNYFRNSESVTQRIPIVWTDMPKGGKRPWFICPVSKNGIYCGRRVGKLFLSPGGTYFACRHCYNLAYESQQWQNRRYKLWRAFSLGEKSPFWPLWSK